MTITKFWGYLKFQLGHRKFYLNSPQGYSRKIINAQTDHQPLVLCPPRSGAGGPRHHPQGHQRPAAQPPSPRQPVPHMWRSAVLRHHTRPAVVSVQR